MEEASMYKGNNLEVHLASQKDWQVSEYCDEIHNHLRMKEKSRFLYYEKSDQLHLRKSVVLWMIELSEKLGFCVIVRHLAVYLLDIFMDHHDIDEEHLNMVAVGCLILAVKAEEDYMTPRNSTFNALLGNQYKLSEFVMVEMDILKFFEYEVLLPTAAHFAEYYSLYALSAHEVYDKDAKPLHNSDILKLYTKRYIDYFLGMSLMDIVFHKYAPSIVASACILATRLCLSLSPPWSNGLQFITGYKFNQLKPCTEVLIRTLNTEIVVDIASRVFGSTSNGNSDSSPANPIVVLHS